MLRFLRLPKFHVSRARPHTRPRNRRSNGVSSYIITICTRERRSRARNRIWMCVPCRDIYTPTLSDWCTREVKSAHTHTQQKTKKNRANFYANLNAQKKARARSDDINYLCCSQTWKKPRFQLKMPFAWLSLTCLQNYSFSFSIFFVVTTPCAQRAFYLLPFLAERGHCTREG